MSDLPPTTPAAGLRTDDAAAALLSLREPAEAAADAIGKAFSQAGASLTTMLAKAASDGKSSLAELAVAVAGIGGASATAGATGTLAQALGSALAGAFQGGRADGGPVRGGGAYLVGERGPEVFRPQTNGEIASASSGGGTVVNVTVQGGGAAGLLRSEAQIAAALSRAASLGMRS